MTCEHCRAAVAAEVGALPGARDVQVDLAAGTITIRGHGVEDAAVAAAVREAGYEVAPTRPEDGSPTSA